MHPEAQDPPWRAVRAFPQDDGSALVHLHNVSGGVLAGDDLALEIAVGPGARAKVTTTGATRLYRHRAGMPESRQRNLFRVARGGILEFLPDALIPFASARHHQSTEILLEDGATLFAWETLAPGRQAMNERFQFGKLRLSTRVAADGAPIVLEEFELEPGVRRPDSMARFGSYTHLATFYAVQAGRPEGGFRELERLLGELAIQESRQGCTIWGTSTLARGGVTVKGLSNSADHLPAALAGFWAAARRYLIGDEAVPPRKLK